MAIVNSDRQIQWDTENFCSNFINEKAMTKKIIETERLYLEELEQRHFNKLFRLLSNQRVQRYFPKTLNKQETQDFLNKIQHHYKTYGHSFWAVIRKTDDEFIGVCGLLNQQIEGVEEIEVAYRLLDDFWGNSYGTEAAKGCLDYAKNQLNATSVISLILAENKQSIRVAEKNGLRFERETLFQGLPHRFYRKEL